MVALFCATLLLLLPLSPIVLRAYTLHLQRVEQRLFYLYIYSFLRRGVAAESLYGRHFIHLRVARVAFRRAVTLLHRLVTNIDMGSGLQCGGCWCGVKGDTRYELRELAWCRAVGPVAERYLRFNLGSERDIVVELFLLRLGRAVVGCDYLEELLLKVEAGSLSRSCSRELFRALISAHYSRSFDPFSSCGGLGYRCVRHAALEGYSAECFRGSFSSADYAYFKALSGSFKIKM